MKPFRTPLRAVVEINVNLLFVAGCGYVGWAIWPQDPEWWGFGIIGATLVIAAIGASVKALRLMSSVYMKDRAVADFMAQGATPKASRLASTRDLENAGMLDG